MPATARSTALASISTLNATHLLSLDPIALTPLPPTTSNALSMDILSQPRLPQIWASGVKTSKSSLLVATVIPKPTKVCQTRRTSRLRPVYQQLSTRPSITAMILTTACAFSTITHSTLHSVLPHANPKRNTIWHIPTLMALTSLATSSPPISSLRMASPLALTALSTHAPGTLATPLTLATMPATMSTR
jgi:hypothetical protein